MIVQFVVDHKLSPFQLAPCSTNIYCFLILTGSRPVTCTLCLGCDRRQSPSVLQTKKTKHQ